MTTMCFQFLDRVKETTGIYSYWVMTLPHAVPANARILLWWMIQIADEDYKVDMKELSSLLQKVPFRSNHRLGYLIDSLEAEGLVKTLEYHEHTRIKDSKIKRRRKTIYICYEETMYA